jgi:DNA-binding transcriptional regulator YiaG
MEQDWEIVTIRKKASMNTPLTSVKTHHTAISAATKKIAEADEPFKTKSLSPESRQQLIQQRAALKMNQIQLNQLCGFPANTIRDIESGRVVPGQGQLNLINRHLKISVKLC